MESLRFLHAFFESFERVGVLGPHAEYVEGGYACVIPATESETPLVQGVVGKLFPETYAPLHYKLMRKACVLHRGGVGYTSTRQMDEDKPVTFPLGGAAVRVRDHIFAFASDVGDEFMDEAIALYAAIRAEKLTWRMARKIAYSCEDPNVIFLGLNARSEPPKSRLVSGNVV